MGIKGDPSVRLLLVGLAIAAVSLAAGVVAHILNDDGDVSVALVAASVTDCPGGSELTTYSPGSRVYAIGRTESSDWIQVRDLSSPDNNVWVRASDIDLDASAADLPVTDCPVFDGIVAVGVGVDVSSTTTTTTPEATSTTVVDSTTTTSGETTTTPATTTTSKPTTTTSKPTTTSTTAPDATPPQISLPSAKPAQIWEEDGFGISCPSGTNRQSTISAVVTDNFGVTSVIASWSDPFGTQIVVMSNSGNSYTATFGPYAAGDWDPLSISPYDHFVVITITATDTAGNTTSTTISLTIWEIGVCFI
jgi:hypothetical protein